MELPLWESQNQATFFLKDKLCKISEEQYRNPDSQTFFPYNASTYCKGHTYFGNVVYVHVPSVYSLVSLSPRGSSARRYLQSPRVKQ